MKWQRGSIYRCICIHGWMDGWMDGWMEGWTAVDEINILSTDGLKQATSDDIRGA